MNDLIIIIKSELDLTKDIVKNAIKDIEIEEPIFVRKICAFTSEEELDMYIDDECTKEEIIKHINKVLMKNNPDIDKSIVSIITYPIKYHKDKIIEIEV